jgi:hypothetical protein
MSVKNMSNEMLEKELHQASKLVCIEASDKQKINDVWYDYIVSITNEMNRRYQNGKID